MITNFAKLSTIFVLCSGCLLSTSPALAQKTEITPEFDVGDKWTFRYSNLGDKKEPVTYTHQAISSKNDSAWIYGESQDPNARRSKYILQFDYKRAKNVEGFEFKPTEPNKAGSRYGNWQPQNDVVSLPLEVGKKFKFDEEYSNGNGTNEYTATVEAFEKVKTEAGEFEAYRIKYSGWWNSKTSSGEGISGKLEMMRWWSPAVKREVKISFKSWTGRGKVWGDNETELVKWEPKAQLPQDFANK